MRFLLRLLPILAVSLAILGAGLVAELPGPHRIFAPEEFGAVEVAPGVFSDDPRRGAALVPLVEEAARRSAAFFGATSGPRPRVLLCTTAACAATFGIPGRGLTIADRAVLIAPSGLTAATLMHERVHVDIHTRMSPLEALTPRYPSWFNEGLATHLSGTPPVRGPADPRAADWIAEAATPLAWRRMRQGRDPAEYYGASARLVAEIEDRAGREGLRALVLAVAQGADFDTEYARALGR